MIAPLLAGILIALATMPVLAQAPDADQGFVDFLRRQDPAAADRYIVLRDVREAARVELEQASRRYSAGGSALRSVSLPELQRARRHYAEASLALLDFLDTRDRGVIARLEADIERVKRTLQERAAGRAEMERMLRGE